MTNKQYLSRLFKTRSMRFNTAMPRPPKTKPVQRTILHMDMDAFYASVEEREHPELRGRAIIVGGNASQRGVVAAANYKARSFGIHSAMPTKTAMQRCPDAILLAPRIHYYNEISQAIHAILERFTPIIEPLSLDEAFLDISGSLKLFGSAESIGQAIQQGIRDELGLVASIGIAPNKFIAKIASDIDKPNGFVHVYPHDIQAFLDPLPIKRLWGVGCVTARRFAAANLYTLGDLRRLTKRQAMDLLGQHGEHFWRLAHGMDERPVIAEHRTKSISHETTFDVDIHHRDILMGWLFDLTGQVMRRVRKKGFKGRTIHIKVRFNDFTTVARSHTLHQATDTTQTAWQTARQLFERLIPPSQHMQQPVRLIGMGIDGFEQAVTKQGELFAAPEQNKQRTLDRTIDSIQERFGTDILKRAMPQRKV